MSIILALRKLGRGHQQSEASFGYTVTACHKRWRGTIHLCVIGYIIRTKWFSTLSRHMRRRYHVNHSPHSPCLLCSSGWWCTVRKVACCPSHPSQPVSLSSFVLCLYALKFLCVPLLEIEHWSTYMLVTHSAIGYLPQWLTQTAKWLLV
jgi:hypothetical protein